MEQQKSVSPKLPTSRIEGTRHPAGNAQDLNVQGSLIAILPQFTPEEVAKIKTLLDESVPKSKRQKTVAFLGRQTSNPLLLLTVGFLLTSIIASGITYRYTMHQQDVAATRSFTDELNKVRVQKVGEVWERLDADEFAIDKLLQDSTGPDIKDGRSPDDRVLEATKLVEADRAFVTKNRFWLGNEISNKADAYLDATIKYAFRKLTGSSEEQLKEYDQKRKMTKFDIEQVREQFLRGNSVNFQPRSSLLPF